MEYQALRLIFDRKAQEGGVESDPAVKEVWPKILKNWPFGYVPTYNFTDDGNGHAVFEVPLLKHTQETLVSSLQEAGYNVLSSVTLEQDTTIDFVQYSASLSPPDRFTAQLAAELHFKK